MRGWLAGDVARVSTSCLSASSSSWLIPLMRAGKNRSSEKTRPAGSGTTSANRSLRWVTRLRAATLGTYPSSATARRTASWMSGATVVEPLTTRETVARDTPARRATRSSVGRSRWIILSRLILGSGCGYGRMSLPPSVLRSGPGGRGGHPDRSPAVSARR